MAYEIRELTTVDEWRVAFPVMNQLRTHLDEETFLTQVTDMQRQGYRLFALFENERAAAVTGIIHLRNLYNGNHIFVYDLVTDESNRSKGYGEALLSYIHQLAEELGCNSVALTSGFQRKDAHRFYEEKMGYAKTSYAFVKTL
ncbi:GNAT family N-acetyltransferase [Fredinandcohnia humi]